MLLEVVGFVAGLDPGFSGRGGGARSGSELSHLKFASVPVSLIGYHDESVSAYIGTDARPESEIEGRCLKTSSRSRDSSLSTDGIFGCSSEECWRKPRNVAIARTSVSRLAFNRPEYCQSRGV